MIDANMFRIRDVHGVMLCQEDGNLRCIHKEAGLVTPDGMPLVWLLRMAGSKHCDRVYGPDLMLAVMAELNNYAHYLYGSSESTLLKLKANLERVVPTVNIVGMMSPPFAQLRRMKMSQSSRPSTTATPTSYWVGPSTPKQERWMAKHRAALNAKGVNRRRAAFDFHAGTVKQAPRWMQNSGLEWFSVC